MTWAALLEGSQRDLAMEATERIAQALLTADMPPGETTTHPTLNGSLGTVLFLTALGEKTDRAYLAPARELFDDAAERVAAVERPGFHLYSTPVGIAWVDAVVRERLADGDDEDGDEDDDVALFVSNVLATDAWHWSTDLLHGLAGLGVYCLSRLPRPSARRDLGRVVRHLANTAVELPGGLTWRYVPPPEGLFEFNEHRPEGTINLGFAHGVPAVVSFLAAAHRLGVEGAGELLDPAVRWLAAQRRPAGSEGSAYSDHVIPGREPLSTRLAWCYGDPGIALALLAAGDALGDDELVEQAREVALGCADQSPDSVVDATLCHGSAGLGHVFHRLGRALGDERVLDLARHWFSVTLDRDLPLLTVVDIESAKRLAAEGRTLAVDPGRGFLFGPAGAGLALLAAAGDEEPWWDAAMLVQPPGTWREPV